MIPIAFLIPGFDTYSYQQCISLFSGRFCEAKFAGKNSGNIYDGEKRTWLENSDPLNYGIAASDWFRRGARFIGGCCQIGPEHIDAMKTNLLNQGFYKP